MATITLDNIDTHLQLLFWEYSTSDNKEVIRKISNIIKNYDNLYDRHTRANNLFDYYINLIKQDYDYLNENYEFPEIHHGYLWEYDNVFAIKMRFSEDTGFNNPNFLDYLGIKGDGYKRKSKKRSKRKSKNRSKRKSKKRSKRKSKKRSKRKSKKRSSR